MRADTLTVTAALVVLAATTAVSVVRADCPSAHASRSLLTFNTGLTPTVPGYTDRRAKMVTNAKKLLQNASFVCLQEVWCLGWYCLAASDQRQCTMDNCVRYENDVKALVDILKSDFPYHFSAIHSSVGKLRKISEEKKLSPGLSDRMLPGRHTFPCGVKELSKITLCVGSKCLRASDLRHCTMDKCKDYVYALSGDCRACLFISASSIGTVWRMCADVKDKFNRINRPGLLVLSKLPLDMVEYVNYWEGTKVLIERGYINVKVKGVNPNYLCTHLTSFLPTYYEKKFPQFSNYKEQHKGEIEQLRNFTASQYVVMGDFNTGPNRCGDGLPELVAELPDNYRLLTEDFSNPYLLNGGACTLCPSENPASKGTKDKAIDFVLTKNVTSDVTSAKRVLDDVDVLLSDHFGVKLDICLPGYKKNVTSGYDQKNVTSGYDKKNMTSGYDNKNVTSGYDNKNVTSGYESGAKNTTA